jgi:hypothetical protein
MAEAGFPHHPGQLDRRRFLTAAAAATAAFGPVAAPPALGCVRCGADMCRSAEPIESNPETALAHAVALRRELP